MLDEKNIGNDPRSLFNGNHFSSINTYYVTGFGETGLIAGLVKIDFFPEKASTKFKYCLRKI